MIVLGQRMKKAVVVVAAVVILRMSKKKSKKRKSPLPIIRNNIYTFSASFLNKQYFAYLRPLRKQSTFNGLLDVIMHEVNITWTFVTQRKFVVPCFLSLPRVHL